MSDRKQSIDTTPLFAVVGATDFAVERVRALAADAGSVQARFEAAVQAVQADVTKRVGSLDTPTIKAQAQEVPLRAAGRALEAAGRAEAAYEQMARRGRELVHRVRTQSSTQDFVHQAGNTLSRGRAAVTVARKAADDTATAVLGAVTVGRRETATVVTDTRVDTAKAARTTRTATKKATTTTRKRAAATTTAVKGARTSAGRTARKAGTATKTAAKKVGD